MDEPTLPPYVMCWHGFRYPTRFLCPVCGETPVTMAALPPRVKKGGG